MQANDWAVSCHPVDGVTPFTVEHLHLNQVLPLLLSAQGQQVYHASAVVIDGAAIAFMGESGRGKSTLAAAFAVVGSPFLTDDGLVLERADDGRFLALPSHPSIRLWADSANALVPAGAACAPAVQYSPKARFLASESLVFSASPVPLQRVFYLGDGQTETPRIEPLSARDAMTQLIRHSFLLDFDARTRLQSYFTATAALANQPLHYRLEYPRSFKALDSLRAAILDHLGAAHGRQHPAEQAATDPAAEFP